MMKKILPESVSTLTATNTDIFRGLFLLGFINMMMGLIRGVNSERWVALASKHTRKKRKTEVFRSLAAAHNKELAQLGFTFLRFFFQIQTTCTRPICLFISILYIQWDDI